MRLWHVATCHSFGVSVVVVKCLHRNEPRHPQPLQPHLIAHLSTTTCNHTTPQPLNCTFIHSHTTFYYNHI